MPQEAMRFYTISDAGVSRSLTPEGFLLCKDVAIARTGIQIYGDNEVPIEADNAGLVRIYREDAEVFRKETMASFEGKPVTIDHPPDLVTPDNWKEHAVGTVQNVHRGSGMESDLLYADLLITDKEAIDAIEDGKIEVSCGYDAEYEQTAVGYGRQLNIIGNHVALVDKGRCGERCAIGDKRSDLMPQTMKQRVIDKIMTAFKTRDAKQFDDCMGDLDTAWEGNGEGQVASQGYRSNPPSGGTRNNGAEHGEQLRQILDRLDAMDAKEEEEEKKTKDKKAKDEEEEKEKEKKKAEDAEKEKEDEEENKKKTGDSLKQIRIAAAILAPTLKVPTVDCACTDKKKTADALLDIKRKALASAYTTADGIKAITPFLDGQKPTFDTLPETTIDLAFLGATELMRISNNGGVKTTNDNKVVDVFSRGGYDKMNSEFWNKFKRGA